MSKKLSEMTLEELWRLFPISLTEHKPYWAEWYDEEAELLRGLLPTGAEIHHVGSTAVPDIMAKPIIDILVVIDAAELEPTARLLERHGYIIMSTSADRISLNKGYTERGFAERVFHVHLRLRGDADEIYFRDYLISHPDVAKEYERLKARLANEHEHDRDAYTDGKTEFVKRYTRLAKERE